MSNENQNLRSRIKSDVDNASNTMGLDKLKASSAEHWAEAGDAIGGGMTLKSTYSVGSDIGKYGLGKDFVNARFGDTLAGKIRSSFGGGTTEAAQGKPNTTSLSNAVDDAYGNQARPVLAGDSETTSLSRMGPTTPAPAAEPTPAEPTPAADDSATPEPTTTSATTETANLTGETDDLTTNVAPKLTQIEQDYQDARSAATGVAAKGLSKVVGNIQGGLDIYDAISNPKAFTDGYNASSAKGTGWEYASHLLGSAGTVADIVGIFVPGAEELGAGLNLAAAVTNTVGQHELAKGTESADSTSATSAENNLKSGLQVDPNLQSAGLIASSSNNIRKQSTVGTF